MQTSTSSRSPARGIEREQSCHSGFSLPVMAEPRHRGWMGENMDPQETTEVFVEQGNLMNPLHSLQLFT